MIRSQIKPYLFENSLSSFILFYCTWCPKHSRPHALQLISFFWYGDHNETTAVFVLSSLAKLTNEKRSEFRNACAAALRHCSTERLQEHHPIHIQWGCGYQQFYDILWSRWILNSAWNGDQFQAEAAVIHFIWIGKCIRVVKRSLTSIIYTFTKWNKRESLSHKKLLFYLASIMVYSPALFQNFNIKNRWLIQIAEKIFSWRFEM